MVVLVMNPGPVEEAGRVAGGFITAMQTQPLALALVMCNVLLLLLFFYVINVANKGRTREFTAIMQMQREVQQMLYRCTPDRPQG
jgi:hypothetical protein